MEVDKLTSKYAENDNCFGHEIFSVIPLSDNISNFALCLKDREITLSCPKHSYINQITMMCEPMGPCHSEEDGTLIPSTSPGKSKYRGFSICKNGVVAETIQCDDATPFFNGKTCVDARICAFAEDGTRFSAQSSPIKYYECQHRQPVLKSCPNNTRFSFNSCIPTDACQTLENGQFLKYDNSSSYYLRCEAGKSYKRQCAGGHDEVFSLAKKMCLPKTRCTNRPGALLAVPNQYAARTEDGIRCSTDGEVEEAVRCKANNNIFDETTGICRNINLCIDLLPGKVFPITEISFRSCRNQSETFVEFGKVVDEFSGTIDSICKSSPDGKTFGPRFLEPNVSEYVMCRGGKHDIKSCPKYYKFLNGKCTFEPCYFRNKGAPTFGIIPGQPMAYYFCRASNITYTVDCPAGTRVDESVPRCVLDKSATKAQKYIKPIVISLTSYTDPSGKKRVCKDSALGNNTPSVGAINNYNIHPQLVNPFLFRCSDPECSNTNRFSWVLVPVNRREGVVCVNGKAIERINCSPGYLNHLKIFKGGIAFENCSSDPGQSDVYNDSYIDYGQTPARFFYYNKSELRAIDADVFPKHNVSGETLKNEELLKSGEQMMGGLNRIVDDMQLDDPNAKLWVKPCSGKKGQIGIPGFPRKYQNCNIINGPLEYCPNRQMFISGSCVDAKIFPIFSNCNVFALGASEMNYRVFRCPEKKPIFSYNLKKCVSEGPVGHFLCEKSFFLNFEKFVKPIKDLLLDPSNY